MDYPGLTADPEMMMQQVLSDCYEAFCEDCNIVLAQGTGPYQRQVAHVAYMHSEEFDHDTHVRTWLD